MARLTHHALHLLGGFGGRAGHLGVLAMHVVPRDDLDGLLVAYALQYRVKTRGLHHTRRAHAVYSTPGHATRARTRQLNH